MPDSDIDVWQRYCAAENAFIELRMRLAKDVADLTGLIRGALHRVIDRGNALRLLAILPVDASLPHLDRLVLLSSVAHGDIEPSRLLLGRLHARGYRDRIARAADDVLANGGVEEFRRIAELYAQIDPVLLRAHLDRCALSPDPEIQEISADFAAPVPPAPASEREPG
jgi:hypothetical protein